MSDELGSGARVCVVTGAARGLGRSVAEAFAAGGDRVVIVDRAARGSDTVDDLRSEGADAYFECVDVSDARAVESMASRIRERLGRVDVLVNNAGVALREGSVATMTLEQWDLTIRVNLTSVYLVSHALIPLMPRGSCIVNVATTGAMRAVPGTDAYLAAKGGVLTLSKAMAVSLGELGIRVNAVSPGVVLTSEVESRMDDPRVRAMLGRAGEPAGRGFGRPSEFASVVHFLCSEAASYVNGANMVVDGGALS